MGSLLSVGITSQQMSTCLIRGLICMELQLLLHTVYKVLTDFCGKVYHHFSFANTFSIIYKRSVNGLLLMYFSFSDFSFWSIYICAGTPKSTRFPCSTPWVTTFKQITGWHFSDMSCQLQALKRKVQGTCLQITVVLTEAMKHWCCTGTSKHFGALQTRKQSNKIRISVCISVLAYESIPLLENEMLSYLCKLGFLWKIPDKCPVLCYRETLMTEPALHGAILGERLESWCCGNRGGDVDKERADRRTRKSRQTSLSMPKCKFTNMKAWIFSQNSFVNLFYTSFLSTVLLYVTFC